MKAHHLLLLAISLGGLSDLHAQSQQELNQHERAEFDKADAKLNQVYAKVQAKLDKEGKEKLKAAQRAWVAFRDAQADLDADIMRGGSAAPMLHAGSMAQSTSKRTAELPDVPTVAESGYPGFDAPAWWAVLAPAKTPPEIVRRMNEELNKALKSPDVAARLAGQGITVIGGSPEVARGFIDKQVDLWTKVVRENNIKAD